MNAAVVTAMRQEPAREREVSTSTLSEGTLPSVPEDNPEIDLRAHLKTFANNPNLTTLIPVTRVLLELAELNGDLKKELHTLFEHPRPREEVLMLSDAFLAYAPLNKRLPDKMAAAAWSQDRANHPEVYCVIGILAAAAKLAEHDRMLTQKILAVDPIEENASQREDDRKRLFQLYKDHLFCKESGFLRMLKSEYEAKNPLAVTMLLKGYLVPLLEIEHGLKKGFFAKMLQWTDDISIPSQLNVLAEGGLTPNQTRELLTFLRACETEETKPAPGASAPGTVKSLKQLSPPKIVDSSFVEAVLQTEASITEKLLFLHGAVNAAEQVSELGLYSIVEKMPRGDKSVGSPDATGWKSICNHIDVKGYGDWGAPESGNYDIALLVTALRKCGGIENHGYFNIAKTKLLEDIRASDGWARYGDKFKTTLLHYIDSLSVDALKKKRWGL